MLNIRIPDDVYGKKNSGSNPAPSKPKISPSSPKPKSPSVTPKNIDLNSQSLPNNSTLQSLDSESKQELVNEILTNVTQMIGDFKNELNNALMKDSLRDIYDKISSNALVKSKVQGMAGGKFSIIDFIIKSLLPPKELVHTISTIILVLMLIGQAVLIYELFRVRSYCTANSNLTSLASTSLICIMLSGVMAIIEAFLFLYLIRTGNTYDRHNLRYILNLNLILMIGLYGMVSSLSNSWDSVKTSTVFMNSVSSNPNTIPRISKSVSFSNSMKSLLFNLILITWFYLSFLDTFVLPLVQTYGSKALDSF